MRQVIVSEWMSLDGVVQAPIGADEDTSNGFDRGGWHLPFFDSRSQDWVVEGLREAAGFLFGRGTYDAFAAYWPNAGEDEQMLAAPLNTKPKYVASRTLVEPLAWQNATLLGSDLLFELRRLRAEDGGPLHVIGSPAFARYLLTNDLVDGMRLMIDPLLLGGGKRFFPFDEIARSFSLVSSETVSTGAVLASYSRTAGMAAR
jgi:dihydrofolate reductase